MLIWMQNPAAFGRLCVETAQVGLKERVISPAAFGRLCVETQIPYGIDGDAVQPPSGGCVLKLLLVMEMASLTGQPPSGGCVLKPNLYEYPLDSQNQPPSGGCVLKLARKGRLLRKLTSQPPSGGCVLKLSTHGGG